MIMRTRYVAPITLSIALCFSACGGDEKSEGAEHEHDDHEHGDGGEPDGGYPDAPCDPQLPPLAPGLEQLGSSTMMLKAKLVSSDPIPLLKGTADWVLDISTTDGTPVSDLEFIDVYTYMPVHGHHGNFKPMRRALPEPGRYELDGLNFTMRGPWQVRLEVSSPTAGDDYIIIDVCVEEE